MNPTLKLEAIEGVFILNPPSSDGLNLAVDNRSISLGLRATNLDKASGFLVANSVCNREISKTSTKIVEWGILVTDCMFYANLRKHSTGVKTWKPLTSSCFQLLSSEKERLDDTLAVIARAVASWAEAVMGL